MNYEEIIDKLYLRFPDLRYRPCELFLTRYQIKELTDMEFVVLYQLEGVIINTTPRSFNWIQRRAEELGVKQPDEKIRKNLT